VINKDLSGKQFSTKLIFHGSHISIILGLLTATLVTSKIFGKISFRGFWCWVSGDPPIAEMVYLYGPMSFYSLAALVCWVKIIVTARAMRLDSATQFFAVLMRHIVMAGVFLGIFLAMFIHRLYNAISGKDSFGLMLAHIIALCGIGTWLFIIFCPSKNNLELWLELFRKCCRKQEYELVN
jgi:hypothetical protein